MADVTVLKPFKCLDEDFDGKVALIKLNTAFRDASDIKLFALLWKHAVLRACTDGAANVLHDCAELNHVSYIPSFISGDFDSIRPEVMKYYSDKGCEIIATPDQDETDFTKCLQLIVNKIQANSLKVDRIVSHVNTEGRLDHILANINTLFLVAAMTTTPVYLITGESLSCLLQPGKTVIEVESPLRGSWCSLVPVGQPCQQITTTGLLYNLDKQSMRFGELISTSNAFDGSATATVETDQPLLLSIGIHV